ncbi:hypothetical protein [Pseudomonas sp. FW300-N2A2]|uniref:hypothetical protein n=1 Tax=Pseudomonas sp. FW300-N2A2 TaxID=2751316 RepID=UPI001A925893|nr:hypothetical protein [Pseudomonas sp. FW300-N2A2]
MGEKRAASINPENPRQARAFYCLRSADDAGESRNAWVVMRELSESLGFKLLDSCPQTIAEGIDWWIEFEVYPELPAFVYPARWKRIGQA